MGTGGVQAAVCERWCAGGDVQASMCGWRCAGGDVQVAMCRHRCAGSDVQASVCGQQCAGISVRVVMCKPDGAFQVSMLSRGRYMSVHIPWLDFCLTYPCPKAFSDCQLFLLLACLGFPILRSFLEFLGIRFPTSGLGVREAVLVD